jgi:ABC-type iron transport system FetAB permease component
MDKSIKSISLNQGIILGVILTLVTVLIYAFSIDLFTEWWLGILLFLIILIFGIIAAVKARKALGGFMTFKEAFTSYFITVAIGTLISTIVGIVIFALVDPDAAQYLNEKIIEMTMKTMESFGAPQDSINEALAGMEDKNNFSAAMQMQSYVIRLLILSVIGLIVGVSLKKSDPNLA